MVARIKLLQDLALNLADQSEQEADVDAMYVQDPETQICSKSKINLTYDGHICMSVLSNSLH